MSNNTTRQQLYDRIRASSKDEVILEEMKRLGFWPDDKEKPAASETLLKRQGELQREMTDLLKRQRLYDDPEQAVKEMRKQRMADAKLRRIETKQRRLQKKYDKALRWYERSGEEVLYLGQGVSTSLNNIESTESRLNKYQLPILNTAKQLADRQGIELSELRFLAFARKISRVSHYQRFTLSKKSGGERIISAPMPRLKRAQYWILDNILEKIPLHDNAHGFRVGRSIVSNAKPHVGSAVVINYDLKDFFPTFSYPRIRGVFSALGYSKQVATILGLLCTEPETTEVILDGERYYVSSGERYLPQGAPSSPALTNIICRRLDRRLSGAAKKLGFNYSRYADDMTFSGDVVARSNLTKLKWCVRAIITDEGLMLHPDKTRIMHRGSQQQVTGIVVNDKVSLDRKTLRKFRALLHQIDKDGPQDKRWGQATNVLDSIRGYANFVAMVDPQKGEKYRAIVNAIIKKYAYKPAKKSMGALCVKRFRQLAALGKAPRDVWWVPTPRPEPVLTTLEVSKKPVLEHHGHARSDQRTTTELVNEARRQSTRHTGLPAEGFFRLLGARLKSIIFWIAIVYLTLRIAMYSTLLAIVFFVTILFIFRRG
jgi:retron-type reverse transcriptase